MGDLPTRADLFNVARRALQSAPGLVRLNPKVVDVPGSNLNIVANVSALVGEELSRAFQQCVRNLYVATARGVGLDKKIMDDTGGQLPRNGASAATVTLTISRPTAGAGAGIYPAGSRVTSPGGVQFSLDADAAFAAADLTGTANATCTSTGPGGRVAAGALSKFVDQPFDSTMTVTNLAGAAGGVDEEDDVRYAARFFGFFPTIRRATVSAIQQAALGVSGVEIATAIEVVNDFLMPQAAVQLIVGDGDGNSSATMLQQVKDALLTYRGLGIPVAVLGGAVAFEPVTWRGLSYLPNVDTVAAQNAVRAVTVAVSQFLSPGGTLMRSSLISAARAVPGVVVGDSALLAPAGDVLADPPTVILRTRPSDVTFS